MQEKEQSRKQREAARETMSAENREGREKKKRNIESVCFPWVPVPRYKREGCQAKHHPGAMYLIWEKRDRPNSNFQCARLSNCSLTGAHSAADTQ